MTNRHDKAGADKSPSGRHAKRASGQWREIMSSMANGAGWPMGPALPTARRGGIGRFGTMARTMPLVSMVALAACAHVPTDPEARAEFRQNNDPAEATNRKIFAANQYVDRHALQPVARAWSSNVPRPVRGCIHNFGDNLGQPQVAMNDMLQGNFGRAWTTTQRFAINTTIGGIGLFDVATGWHRPGHEADLGQTLGVWGVGPGPAVQLPLFGPSNVRDTVGKIAGIATNPATYLTAGIYPVVQKVSGGLNTVDGRARLLGTTDTLQKTSLDYYAALRSASAQHREALVVEGRDGGPDNGLKPAGIGPDGAQAAADPRPL